MRGLGNICTFEGHTADEKKWALEGLTANVTECTIKELIVNETKSAVIRNGAGMTQCATMKLTVDAAE